MPHAAAARSDADGPVDQLAARAPALPEPWCRNLHHTFDELLAHLHELAAPMASGGGDERATTWDVYLTVCALWQIVEDFLHRGFLALQASLEAGAQRPKKLDRHLEFLPPWAARTLRRTVTSSVLRIAAGMVDGAAGARVRLRAVTRERDLRAVAGTLRDGALALAGAWARPDAGMSRPDRHATVGRLLASLDARRFSPMVGCRILKIPSCFHDFDCHPDDCRELVRRFAATAPDRGLALTVLGIRTSGTYLAPLCAAFLQQLGFTDVEVATVRPKVPLFRGERSGLRRRGRRGRILIVDDPPVTGTSLATVVRALRRLGIPADHLVPLIFGESGSSFARLAAPSLGAGAAIVLPEREWRIRTLLAAPTELRAFASPAPPRTRPAATGDVHGGRTFRCHAKARVGVTNDAPGCIAKGTGLGWFEQHVSATAEALGGFVPESQVMAEGLLLSRWIEGASLADRPQAYDEPLVRHVAAYVAERLRKLPIRSGSAHDPTDRETGWCLLAEVFARSYGVLAPFGRERWRTRLARIAQQAPRAEIDGQMRPAEWILPESGAPPVKVDFEEHGFDRTDRSVLDPAYDLATFAVESRLPAHLQEALLAEYVGLSGDGGAPARFAGYELMAAVCRQADLRAHLAWAGGLRGDQEAAGDRTKAAVEKTEIERVLSRIATELLATGMPAEEQHGARGRLFAVDLDGVLEDCTLGFSAATPAGIASLRTVMSHGFAPVIASGRSLGEVVDRCRALRLQGGTAEYGSVVWIGAEGAPVCLAADETLNQLAALRAMVAQNAPQVIVDPAYQYSVRVFRYDGGWRRAVARDWLEGVLREGGFDRLRVVAGEDQLDVVGKECDKGRALRVLAHRLGADEIHAVGDTLEDVAMWRVATRAYAPANVTREALAAMNPDRLFVARRKRQRGLLEIARVAAHGSNRACANCRETGPDPDVLLRAFGIRDRSWGARIPDLIGAGALRVFRASH